jgi:putative tryptophan/tyrosine transport system substrate-binding protein
MRRREFITFFGGVAIAWPLGTRAQQRTAPVIGFLSPGSPDSDPARVSALRRGLNEAGYVEGQTVTIEYRWAGNQLDRLPTLGADLVQHRVAAIVTPGPVSTLAAKAATSTIPIVFSVGGDPAQLGLVASLSRPGGNLTGSSTWAPRKIALARPAQIRFTCPDIGSAGECGGAAGLFRSRQTS